METNIIISAKNFELKPAHKKYASQKLEHLLKFDSSIFKIRMEMDADKKIRNNQKFRVEVWVDGRRKAKAGAQALTLYSAIDEVIPKLVRQLEKEKEKIIDRRKK